MGFEHISRMDHGGRETLSNHIPVIATLIFIEDVRPGLRKGTYLKMDYRWLNNEDFFLKVKNIWETNRKLGEDPKITWDIGWKKICSLMN